MKQKVLPLIVLLVVVGAGAAAWQLGLVGARPADDKLRVSGNIEVTDVQVAFKIPGRVEQRPVDEGQFVERGQVIAVLDTADLEQEVALRQAELEATQAALAVLLAGSRPEEIAAAKAGMEKAAAWVEELQRGSRPQEIAVAEAAFASAIADQNRRETDFGRIARLVKQNAASQEQYDQARAAHEVASAQVREAAQRLDLAKEGPRREQIDAAKAALAQAQAQYDLVRNGPRKEDIEQARARAAQARASLALAKTRLGYATVVAPMPGMVLSKNIEPGEYVNPGTAVVTIGNLKDIWLRGYINERDSDKVKLGQSAIVKTDSGKTYQGRVSFISDQAEFTPKMVQTEEERVKLVFRVKIDIDNPRMELKPGMPADAEIVTSAPAEHRTPD